MLIELPAKVISIPAVIDALLEFPDESWCKGLDMNSAMAQFQGEEKMVFWGGRKGCLIYGYFKIDRALISSSKTNPFINFFGEVKGFTEKKGVPFNAFLIELDGELSIRAFEYKFFA
jgi:hypothetical protein